MHTSFRIAVATQTVLQRLHEHRKSHIDEYEGQLNGWKAEMEAYATKVNEWAAKGGEKDKPHQPHKPNDYTAEYDELIAMVSEHIMENMTLTQNDFQIIFQDKFQWTESFGLASSMYNNRG